jgi:hypothetical protein
VVDSYKGEEHVQTTARVDNLSSSWVSNPVEHSAVAAGVDFGYAGKWLE